jgi:hypothetical protein
MRQRGHNLPLLIRRKTANRVDDLTVVMVKIL